MLRLSIGSVAAVYLWLGFCWMLEGWEGPRRQRRHAAEAGNSGRVLVCVCAGTEPTLRHLVAGHHSIRWRPCCCGLPPPGALAALTTHQPPLPRQHANEVISAWRNKGAGELTQLTRH